MASENVGIKDNISIKKTTINNKGKPEKTVFFFPDAGRSIEATSYEEALEILNRDKPKKDEVTKETVKENKDSKEKDK